MFFQRKRISVLSALAVSAGVIAISGRAQANTSWALVYKEVNNGNTRISITAPDEQHAWAVGVTVDPSSGNSNPSGLMTSDGVDWQTMSLPPSTGPLDIAIYSQIAFATATTGWMFGEKVKGAFLWQSTDGGANWTIVHTFANKSTQLQTLQTFPTGELFGAGGAVVVRTLDGSNYTEVNPSIGDGGSISSIFMVTTGCGYLAVTESSGTTSSIMYTSDNGDNWTNVASGLPFTVKKMSFVSGSLGWAAGVAGSAGMVASTTNGGKTWAVGAIPDHPATSMSKGVTSPVTECDDLRFFDDKRGVAACMSCTGNCDIDAGETPSYLSVFSRTADGGQTWTMDADYEMAMSSTALGKMGIYAGMRTLAFPTPNTGYISGQYNYVLRYTADSPEPGAWAIPSSCGASGPDGGTGGSGGSKHPAQSGCSCEVPNAPPIGVFPLAALAALLGIRSVRRRLGKSNS